jgi:hypothetical protein
MNVRTSVRARNPVFALSLLIAAAGCSPNGATPPPPGKSANGSVSRSQSLSQAGFYRNTQGGIIYFNGGSTYCVLASLQAYLNAGGPPDASTLPLYTSLSGVENGGSCNLPNRIVSYTQQTQETLVSNFLTPVLSANIINGEETGVQTVIVSDGDFSPAQGNAVAQVQLYLNGTPVGNSSVIDWTYSYNGAQALHSFHLVALATLNPGTNTLSLMGQDLSSGSSFYVGANTSMSVLQSSAQKFQLGQLTQDTISVQDPGIPGFLSNPSTLASFDTPAATYVQNTDQAFLRLQDPLSGPAAVLMGGRAYWSGTASTVNPYSSVRSGYGDGGASISLSPSGAAGVCPGLNQATWAVNDLWPGAEVQAPISSQALYQGGYTSVPEAIAAPFEWPSWALDSIGNPNGAMFRVGASTTLLSIENPKILGGATTGLSPTCNQDAAVCIGSSSSPLYADCPAMGSVVTVAQTTVTIPPGHDGVVLFLAKTRVAGGNAIPTESGMAYLAITIDGNRVGPLGIQQLMPNHADSQRTISTSYLSSGDQRLSVGQHTVQVIGWGVGNFEHLMFFQDLPLVFFD